MPLPPRPALLFARGAEHARTFAWGVLRSRALRIALSYAVIAALWIYFSDEVLQLLFSDPAQIVRWSVFKGFAFIAITSLLLFLQMRRAFSAMAANYAQLKAHEAEIQRLNRLYAALSQINQAIVLADSADALLKQATRVLVEHGRFLMAWVGWHDPATARIRPVAEFGDERGYLDSISLYVDERPEGRGPTGQVFRSGQPHICNDFLHDPATQLWHAEAQRRGIRASAVFPLRQQGKVVGTLTVYAAETGFFQGKEIELLTEAAGDVSFALDRFEQEEQRRALAGKLDYERLFSETMIESMPGIVYFYNEQRRFLRWNRNFAAVSGYTPEEIARMHPLDFFGPADRPLVEARIAEVFERGESSVGAGFVAKDGSVTPYFFTGLRIHREGEAFLLGVGIDISERIRAEDEVRRTNQTLAGIVATLQQIATSELTPAEAMHVLAARAQELTGARGAVIELVEDDHLVSLAGSGIATGSTDRPPLHGSLSGTAVRTGQALLSYDTETDDRIDPETCRHRGVRSMIVAPLREGERIVGVLKAMSDQPGAFSEAHIGQLQILVESFGAVLQRIRATEQLRASEEQYRLLFVNNPHPMWVWDRATLRFLAVNRAAVRHYGYTEEEFLARTILDIRAPDDVTTVEEALARMPAAGPNTGPRRHRRKDGSIIDVEASSDAVVLQGRPAWLALAHDITDRLRAERELARTHRALRMLTRCNEALIRAQTEDALLHAICAIAAENGGYRLAWVGYAQDDARKTIAVQASAGHVDGFFDNAHLSWDELGAVGRGPAGRAIRTGELVTCENIADDSTFALWRDAALARGYRSGIWLPLRDGRRTFGVLGLYSADVRQFATDELGLLRELADDLAFGITNLRTRSEQRRLQAAVVKVAAGVSAATGTEFFEKLATSMAEAVGAHVAAVARFLPGSPGRARTLALVQTGRLVPNLEYDVHATPCAALLVADAEIIPNAAAERYPYSLCAQVDGTAYVGHRLSDSAGRPLGTLFVLFRQQLADAELVSSTLQIFAARAAAEIERQQTDRQVREQAALLDKAQDAILVRDLQHRILYWNKSAERLYGWTADEARGRSVRQLIYLQPDQFDAALQQLLARGEWSGELAQVRQDGQPLTIEARWTLVRDEAGQPSSVLAINTDITERRQLEQQFLRSQRMESIGTLAGGIAHDLNNLLAPILLGVDLLRHGKTNPENEAILASISRSARRGADLIKQVLSFARGVEGARVAVDLARVASEVRGIAESTFPRNITVVLTTPAALWPVIGDATQLNQVLLNLCVNARDAMPSGGELRIALRNLTLAESRSSATGSIAPGRYVVLSVSDTGGGIAREIVDRIFEPFFTTKELGKGTGLGLSTALGIVRSHGGLISVRSQPGQGSVFEVYLPAQIDDATTSPCDAESHALPRGKGETILLVDDEPIVLEITCCTLESFGYRVLTAGDGARALDLFTAQRSAIAVVLTDMMMPRMDGAALIRALRSLAPDLPILAASGLRANDAVNRPADARPTEFIAKPYSTDTLLRALRRVLGDGSRAPFSSPLENTPSPAP